MDDEQFTMGVLAVCSNLFLMAQGGSIQGSVVDATTNNPLAGAFVTAISTGLPPVSQTTKSANDGTYGLQDVAPGTYSLCVQIAGDGYLNPCDWVRTAVTVTVVAGQSVAGKLLKIQRGSVLKVRVQDVGQVLS